MKVLNIYNLIKNNKIMQPVMLVYALLGCIIFKIDLPYELE